VIEPTGEEKATLGEGPLWDHRDGWLLWVDIVEGAVDENCGTMYITTARFGLSEMEMRGWPASGSVFVADRATPGPPANVFSADPWTDPR
jgi:sugar lactone lactonase YvrE